MLFPITKSSKEPLLFDIRFGNVDGDVIVLKGLPSEAPSAFLSGSIVLSVLEPITIKNLTLRLVGKLELQIPFDVKGSDQKRYRKHERKIYEHVWDNFNIKDYLRNLYDNYGKTTSIGSKSTENLHCSKIKSKSNSSLRSLASSSSSLLVNSENNSSQQHTLVKGNYEFPFNAILPGELSESVQGLPNASVVYQLHAAIERSGYYSDLMRTKHITIVRTLAADALELSETVAVDNVWPQKVEYSMSIPAKAVAIGSATPIHIHITPLLKNLKLGPIRISLIEHSQYCGSYGAVTHNERVVCKTKIKDPFLYMTNNFSGDNFQDSWDIDTVLQVPASLSKCTQDCQILKNIKVRHKLKFVVSLINPDGHISELRASLAVQLFISPFVAVSVKRSASKDSLTPKIRISNHESNYDSSMLLNDHDESDDEVIFERSASEVELINTTGSPILPITNLMAPPNYNNHVYDRRCSDNEDGLSQTRSNSNLLLPSRSSINMPLLENSESVETLQMHLQRLSMPSESFQDLTVAKDDSTDYLLHTTEDFCVASHTSSSHPSPNMNELSRASFSSLLQTSSSPQKDWEIQNISRVPSYIDAMKTPTIGSDLPPVYPDQHLGDNRQSALEKPRGLRHRSSSSSALKTSFHSPAVLSRSRNSSNASLDIYTPATSYESTATLSSSTKPSTAQQYFAFGMTPVADSDEARTRPQQLQKRKSNSRQRANSFNSIIDLFKGNYAREAA